MQELTQTWERSFFTEPLLFVVLLFTLLIALKNRKKHKILRHIPLYICSLITVFISTTANNITLNYSGIVSYVDYFFTLIEILIFSDIYLQLTKKPLSKKLVVVLNVIFGIFFTYMMFNDHRFSYGISDSTQSKVYTVEGAILLIVCLFYFLELFKEPSNLNLKNEPVFWITTGLLFFMSCTLPYSILENYIHRNYPEFDFQLYSIFYIFYILLFLMVIRAYLCKPEKTT